MKALYRRLIDATWLPPGFIPAGRIAYWTTTIGKFASVQMLVQAIGAFAGILLVRHLSKGDYALYTIANSMQATMNILADSGVSVALASVGGRIWQNPLRLGELIQTALKMRHALAVFVALAVSPILVWMLIHNHAPLGYCVLLVAAVLMGFMFQLELDVFITVPRLHSEFSRLQSLDFKAAVLRLAMIAVALGVFLNAFVAVGIATVSIAFQRWWAKGWAREHLAPEAGTNAADRREVGEKIRHMLPSALFYCLQGQIVVFLVSLAGHSSQVAEVGALGRLTLLFSVFNPIMSGIVLPAFSRCEGRALLWKRYFLVLGAFLLLGSILVLFAVFFATPLLWLLGSHYAHLRGLLLLMTVNAALGMLSGAMWSMNAAKGWVQHVWMEIPLRLLLQFGLIFAFDLSTPAGALWFSICSQSSPILVSSLLTIRGLRSIITPSNIPINP